MLIVKYCKWCRFWQYCGSKLVAEYTYTEYGKCKQDHATHSEDDDCEQYEEKICKEE